MGTVHKLMMSYLISTGLASKVQALIRRSLDICVHQGTQSYYLFHSSGPVSIMKYQISLLRLASLLGYHKI
jgi:hypothetical protein